MAMKGWTAFRLGMGNWESSAMGCGGLHVLARWAALGMADLSIGLSERSFIWFAWFDRIFMLLWLVEWWKWLNGVWSTDTLIISTVQGSYPPEFISTFMKNDMKIFLVLWRVMTLNLLSFPELLFCCLLVTFIFFHSNYDICNEYHISHESCRCTSPCWATCSLRLG